MYNLQPVGRCELTICPPDLSTPSRGILIGKPSAQMENSTVVSIDDFMHERVQSADLVRIDLAVCENYVVIWNAFGHSGCPTRDFACALAIRKRR